MSYSGNCGWNTSGKCCKYTSGCTPVYNIVYDTTKQISCSTKDKNECSNPNADKNFLSNCCKIKDKSLRPKKGGYINLTKEQGKELIKQIGGNSIKSTYITYNGNNAKILGFNRQTQNLIIQTNAGLENVSVNNLLVNGKSVL